MTPPSMRAADMAHILRAIEGCCLSVISRHVGRIGEVALAREVKSAGPAHRFPSDGIFGRHRFPADTELISLCCEEPVTDRRKSLILNTICDSNSQSSDA